MRLLILGATGMLGNTLLRYFCEKEEFQVFATVRDLASDTSIFDIKKFRLFEGIDVHNQDKLAWVFDQSRPDVIVNCVGVVKQVAESKNALISISLNSLLPHRLASLCSTVGGRLIHFSTDCVFNGQRGQYCECDIPDATDLYGRSKLLGEVDYPNSICLRTSLVGHEVCGSRSLLSWFLAQSGEVRGYTQAIFSGLPTIEIAKTIEEFVLPYPDLRGVYHLSVDPISKYDFLSIVKSVYGLNTSIVPDGSLVINRSLDSNRFRKATGFAPKPWPELIQDMHDFG